MLAVLEASPEPLTIDTVITRLAADGIRLDALTGVSAQRRVSDVLRYQMTLGRVERLSRGVYRFVPGSVTHSTLWRCRNWKQVRR